MLVTALRVMIMRELRALDRELAAYPDDDSIWLRAPGVLNSAGNLTLHIAGNLRHFYGHAMTGSSYVRDRAAEFTATANQSREELREIVADTVADLEVALDKITDSQLASEFPLPIAGRTVRTSDFLVHLAVHLGYHLGQLDYHRRLLTDSTMAIDAMSVTELPLA